MSLPYMGVSLNDQVEVKLTKRGVEVFNQHYRHLFDGNPPETFKKVYTGDYEKFQLWKLMQIFGDSMYIGDSNPPLEINIRIPLK